MKHLEESRLPAGDVTVDLRLASLSDRDALAITGKDKNILHFPMIPGIEFAGTVHASGDHRFQAGQQVLLTSSGVGA
ncbi:alcohol dehydrogenase catalytic domain-containing protein, partial [Salmonella enterica]